MTSKITQEDFAQIPTNTLIRLQIFVDKAKADRRELASLAGQILKDMNRSRNMVEGVLMMKAIEKTRKELRSEK